MSTESPFKISNVDQYNDFEWFESSIIGKKAYILKGI